MNRSKRRGADAAASRRSWQERLLRVLGVAGLIILPFAYLLAGNQTTPAFRMLNPSILQWLPVGAILTSAILLICLYQLLTYFGNWSNDAYKKRKTPFLKTISFVFHVVATGFLAMGFMGVGILFATWFFVLIVNAMNFRLDESQPVQITTRLIERIPSSSLKRADTLKLADWKISSAAKPISVEGIAQIFDINGNSVTFYLREGAFGWPYAIEKSFAIQYRSIPN